MAPLFKGSGTSAPGNVQATDKTGLLRSYVPAPGQLSTGGGALATLAK